MTGPSRCRAAFLLLAAAITACSLLPKRERTPQTTYLLGANGRAPEKRNHAADGGNDSSVTLLVGRPEARPGFDTPRMAYLPDPQEVRYYAFHAWADTPGRMLAPMIVEALEESGCCRTALQMPSPVPGDLRLDVEDLSLGQEFFSSPSVVRLSFRAVLVDLGNREVVAARRFEAVEAAPSEDPKGGAAAAGRAASTVLGQVSEWVAQNVASRADGGGPGTWRGNASPAAEPAGP